jgi:hypothetical protein
MAYTSLPIVKGDELMLFIDNKSIAYATSHSLTLSTTMQDISSKDHGVFGAQISGKRNWEISTENLYTDKYFDVLFDVYLTGKPVTVVFAHAADWDPNGIIDKQENWDPSTGTIYYEGKAVITNLAVTANTGEMSTMSATLTGQGAFEQKNSLVDASTGSWPAVEG